MPNWKGGATGAATGAAAGAALGPWGAAAGGAIGGLIGLFGGGDEKKAELPYFEEDRARLGTLLNGQSPFASRQWGTLTRQLQQRASGQGPSVAGDAYRAAAMDNSNAIASMSRGSASPGAAHQALLQQGRVGQGLAQGYGAARNQEMIGAQSALTQALGTRDQINSNAYLNLLAQQLGLSQAQMGAMIGNQDVAQKRQAAQMNALAAAAGTAGQLAGGKKAVK